MRRALIFLALWVAGAGVHPGDPILPPFGVGPAASGEVSAGAIGGSDVEAHGLALRSSAPAVPRVHQESSGSSPRPAQRASDPTSAYSGVLPRLPHRAANRARFHAWRQYVSALALARAGRLASPTTAPPPARFV